MLKRTSIILSAIVAGAFCFGPMSRDCRAAGNSNPGVAPPQSKAHGLSYGEWGALWFKWAYSFPISLYPPNQSGPIDASLGQSGSVWFLAGSNLFVNGSTVPVTRFATIPTGKALFFPIINFINDYPCPEPPPFQPAPGQSLEDFLLYGNAVSPGGVKAFGDQVTGLNVVVDGVPLTNLFQYRGTSRLFTFTGDISLRGSIDPCITGTPQQGVSDGYWIMLNPLPPGMHTIAFQAYFPGPGQLAQDVTFLIQVVPGGR
jgi:hypothetical protein